MHQSLSLAWLYWDPPREAFTIPYFDLAIMWYGIFFASGFILGYFIFLPMIQQLFYNRLTASSSASEVHEKARLLGVQFTDRMIWFVVIGTIIGARFGHVFFYDWPYYQAHPEEILMLRKGGLASHGGAVGVLIGLYFFLRTNGKRFPKISLLTLLDLIVVPTSMTACFIRLGNFFNQEILGIDSSLPWAIIFGHPAETASVLPRHPAQLYEAAAYLITFGILFYLWKKYGLQLKRGTLAGLFFILVFTSRFFIECIKLPQSIQPADSLLQTGQFLSLPFILLGLAILLWSRKQQELE